MFMGILSMLSGLMGCNAQPQGNAKFRTVDVTEFARVITAPGVVVLDVRRADEYAQGHLADAPFIDVTASDFEARALECLPKDKTIALYCRSGNRSKKAAGILAAAGYKVVELGTGYMGWTAAGQPVTTEEVDIFKTRHGKVIRMYAIKHGSVRMNIDGKWLYIDPVGKAIPPFTDFTSMPWADAILVTHEHKDHLDPEAIEPLMKDGTVLVANPRSSELMGGKGKVLKNGDEMDVLPGIHLKAVPAYNTAADKQQFHPKGRDNGYVITIDGFTVYIAGDTEDIPEMGDLKDVDVAFLPCNLPFTMTPEQLSKAARMFNPRVLFPYHYGQTDIIQAVNLLKDTAIDVRIRQYQ